MFSQFDHSAVAQESTQTKPKTNPNDSNSVLDSLCRKARSDLTREALKGPLSFCVGDCIERRIEG